MSLRVSGELTVAGLLRHRAARQPDEPLIVDDPIDSAPRVFTYGQILDLATNAAEVLASLGIRRGDRFGMVIGNRPEFFSYWFGAALIGAVMVPTNPASTADELGYVFEHAHCKAVVCDAQARTTVEHAWRGAASAIVTADLSARPGQLLSEVDVRPGDPLAVLYTSGTTSRPKGVVITHANYLSAGHTVAGHLRMRPDDRWLVVLPLFHANAQYYCAMSAVVTGASLIVSARFSASRWSAQARVHHATLASMFAAPVRMVLSVPESAEDADNDLRVTVFAQNLTDAERARFQYRFGCRLLQLYGMTETVAPPLMNPLYGPSDDASIGVPTGSHGVRVVDEDGRDVTPGKPGELLVSGEPGDTVMAGYLDDDVATAGAITDGWLHTGDIVRQRGDGFVVFVDRAKNMIKRSGENVAAAEVERVLNDHPAIFESAVVGVPDPVRDEAIKAFVVRADTGAHEPSAQDLIEFCGQRLAHGKVPDVIEFVTQLPRTPVGKIRKHVLEVRAR